MLYWDEIKAKFSDGSKASFYPPKVPGGWLVGIFLGGQAVTLNELTSGRIRTLIPSPLRREPRSFVLTTDRV